MQPQQLTLKAATGLAFAEPWLSLSTKPFDYSAAFSKQSGTAAGAVAAAAMSARPESMLELTFQRGAFSTWMQQPAAAGAAAVAAATKAHVPEGVLEGLAGLAARLHGLMDALAVAGSAAPGGAAGPAADPAATAATAGGPGAATLDVGVSVAAAAAVTAGAVRSEWTSALSSKPQRMLRLDSLPQELAMVYTAYAAALRQAAWQRVAEASASSSSSNSSDAAPAPTPASAEAGSTAGGGGEGGSSGGAATGGSGGGSGGGGGDAGVVAALTAAVAALRRAAGVYDWLGAELLPALGGGAAAQGDVPLELLPAAARCMAALCLAEGQALMAAAAEARGMSPGARRALHGGCVTLFKGAEAAAGEVAAVAGATAGAGVSERLLRLLGAGGALHAAAGCYCLGLERQKELELGEAEASAEECRRLLEAGLKRLDRNDPPAWGDSFKALQAAAAQLAAAAHKDRLAVTYQPLPKQPPDAAANAAVRVAAEPFRPAPVRPPPPPPEAAGGKGGCAIM